MQNKKQTTKGDAIVREDLDSDRDAIIAIFNHNGATSISTHPEMP